MTQRHYVTGRRSTLGPFFFASGIVLLAIAGGALLLHATGVITLGFLGGKEPPPPPVFDTRGKVAVPINVRPIEAYSQVARDDLLNPRSRTIEVVWMREQDVPPDAVTGAGEILGRVLRYDKKTGEIFLKQEFYPPNTRPGPAAGVPPGKRAMQFEASAVPGLHGLRLGDRFDIVTTVEVEIEQPRLTRSPKSDLPIEGPYARLADSAAEDAARQPVIKRKRAEVRVIVRNGILVKPVYRREPTPGRPGTMPVTPDRKKSQEEIIIAVEPSEVAELNQALAIGAQIHVAIRSGQATADGTRPPDEEIPDLAVEFETPTTGADSGSARPKVKLVEVIVGGKKRIIAVPLGADEGETPKDGDEGGTPKDGE